MNIKKVVVGELETNCYIVENDIECFIIYPDSESDKIIKNIDKKVVGILLTHRHFDHVGALDSVSKYYKVPVYDISNLHEGMNVIGNFKFEVRYNLGHTMDSISFIFDNIMFSGDFIFKGCIGRCDLGGDFNLMKESIKSILKSNVNYKIYPGHGDSTYLFDERNMLESYIK